MQIDLTLRFHPPVPQPYHVPHLPSPVPDPDADMSSVRRRPRRPATSGYTFLRHRELSSSETVTPALHSWMEHTTLIRLDTGRYVHLDRAVPLVRSTISIAFSHDGRYYASTHGDHTVKVFEYPSGNQIACLDGHPRTPWTVRFHPSDSSILASGCIGHDCRIWNIPKRTYIRRHNFGASISCVSFSPDGSLLAVTSGRKLFLWNWMQPTTDGGRNTSFDLDGHHGPGIPRHVIEGRQPFHMVDFHPSGTMLMTGEKNETRTNVLTNDAPNPTREQFTLKLVIHRFDRRLGGEHSEPVLVVPRAVAYNDAGIHFSPCGTMLAACIPCGQTKQFHIAVLSLVKRGSTNIGTVLYTSLLDAGRVSALTNLKFSPTSTHLLAGFSFRSTNPVLRVQAEHYDASAGAPHILDRRPPQIRVVDIYHISPRFELIRSLCADMDVSEGHSGGPEDEINVAVFAPAGGMADGIVYGTQKGRIRMFQQAIGTVETVRPVKHVLQK
ncbi:Activating molecule in BECN1-regulated autophagy protein 1 [Gracilariopsis chorda]|uniref:Activating molecule in BECN1-regulated autophagy protein 1 n=1 Tax=Gracilariopsis chorda TaxID=448386 RepID=A0A2V3J629_9FLOR|nr:Activating molecule in BECN1-regulated autophagy protein 1 [Gracilariopsis chorda]|eukprot:PXF49881.1 Activating molecule in BECN1-regulated autophagy protein 1 [Gracilariopsis chorda]